MLKEHRRLLVSLSVLLSPQNTYGNAPVSGEVVGTVSYLPVGAMCLCQSFRWRYAARLVLKKLEDFRFSLEDAKEVREVLTWKKGWAVNPGQYGFYFRDPQFYLDVMNSTGF
jgi:hypothetical protein